MNRSPRDRMTGQLNINHMEMGK